MNKKKYYDISKLDMEKVYNIKPTKHRRRMDLETFVWIVVFTGLALLGTSVAALCIMTAYYFLSIR